MRISTLALAAAASLTAPAAHAQMETVYFGTHGLTEADVRSGQPVPAHGIYAARFDPATGRLTPLGLALELERPTWMVASPDHEAIIYSVNELGNDGKTNGQVLALVPDGAAGKLKVLNQADAKGGGTTFLAVDATTQSLFAANYGGGQAVSFPLNADGTIGAAISVEADSGSGPSPRQKGPHAHAAVVDPSHRFLLVPDLGADRVFIYRIDAATHALRPADPAFETLPPGTGPRHIVFTPNGKFAYLLSELTAEIRTYRWNSTEGTLSLLDTRSTLAKDWYGVKSGGDVELSGDGRFVYVSNRGEDAIAVYNADPESGRLTEIQRLPAQGDQPWHMAFDPSGRWLLVADEASSNVAVFKVDTKTGKLTPTPNQITVPKPANILFTPR